MKTFLIILMALIMAPIAFAQTSAVPDAEVESRARTVGKSLRCVVCQNQSIEESNAPLAKDMRKLVRVQIRAGATNDEIIALMRDRYGDFVLLKPPFQKNTYILWFAPAFLMLASIIWYMRRKRPALVQTELTASEQDRLDELLGAREPKT